MKLYGEISKSEDQDDGTVKVWGYASTASVDSQGEVVTANAMKAALPDYMKFANVREMHTAKAAGIAIEAEVQEDGRTFFGAHVIDSEAVKKVRAGVYKGFSIGGKVTSRDPLNKTTITGLRLSEVSLVDRPANPEATFTFFKADGIEPEAVEVEKAAVEVAPEAVEVQKGMSHVAQLAGLLKQMQSLVSDQTAEAQREGDGSPVPGQLSAAMTGLGAILVTMAQEEVGELTADAAAQASGDARAVDNYFYAADATGDLAKAGATFSASTKTKIGAAHEAMKTACSHLDSLGYGESTKADGTEDLAKVSGLTNDLAKMTGERDTLAKRVAELEAKPAPASGVLKVVGKAEDFNGNPVATEADDAPRTPEQIMKSIHSAGGKRGLI